MFVLCDGFMGLDQVTRACFKQQSKASALLCFALLCFALLCFALLCIALLSHRNREWLRETCNDICAINICTLSNSASTTCYIVGFINLCNQSTRTHMDAVEPITSVVCRCLLISCSQFNTSLCLHAFVHACVLQCRLYQCGTHCKHSLTCYTVTLL